MHNKNGILNNPKVFEIRIKVTFGMEISVIFENCRYDVRE